jgi:hypothetical protein
MLAVLLDPHFKDKWLDFIIESSLTKASIRAKTKKDLFLFVQHNVYYDRIKTVFPESSCCAGKSTSDQAKAFSLFNYIDNRPSMNKVDLSYQKFLNEMSYELEVYLHEDIAPQNIGIMDYWRINKFRFKILSVIARDLLSIPSSATSALRHASSMAPNPTNNDSKRLFYIKANSALLNHI